MASQPTGIAFPLTYDAGQAGPNYSASDVRLTAGAALAVPDGSAFGGIQGVRAGSPSPLVTIDGTTVTVAPHMGWLCPWPGGNGAYEYALPDPVSKPINSTTGSYKIAVILEDKAAGHGKIEQVDVKVSPGYTPDSQIEGLVVARVDNGVVSDVAPVISQDATVRVGTLDQLQGLRAADGVGAVLADGSRYEMLDGSWQPQERIQTGTVTIKDAKLKVDRLERVGRVVHLTGAINEPNAPNRYVYGYIPEGYRPSVVVHITEGDTSGVDGQVGADGAISYTSKAGFNRWIDRTWLAA